MSRDERASRVSSDVGCGVVVGAGEAEDFFFRADDRVAGDMVIRCSKSWCKKVVWVDINDRVQADIYTSFRTNLLPRVREVG